jgi:Protein of unknown function (DUF3619)
MTYANAPHQEVLADRFGLKIAARLNEQPLPHDISERLRVVRMQAIARVPKLQTQTAQTTSRSGGAAVLGGGSFDDNFNLFNRIASALPLLALAAGLVFVSVVADDDNIREIADIDMQLLTDDLPPDAHTDAGFAQFLKFGPPNS